MYTIKYFQILKKHYIANKLPISFSLCLALNKMS